MLTLRTFKQIADSRTIPSFRACRSHSRCAYSRLNDHGRRVQGQVQRLAAESRRQWLTQQWEIRRPQ